jgi:hypothetical protein
MDKYEFMNVIQECFDNCNDEQLETRANEMIEAIKRMFKLESTFRKYEREQSSEKGCSQNGKACKMKCDETAMLNYLKQNSR